MAARNLPQIDPWPEAAARLIPEPDIDEVLREQLEHLIAARTDIGASTAERERLHLVTEILLSPFDVIASALSVVRRVVTL